MGRGGYNGGGGEVGALWPPASFSFGCPSLKFVVSEVEILLPFPSFSFLCFLPSAVLFE